MVVATIVANDTAKIEADEDSLSVVVDPLTSYVVLSTPVVPVVPVVPLVPVVAAELVVLPLVVEEEVVLVVVLEGPNATLNCALDAGNISCATKS